MHIKLHPEDNVCVLIIDLAAGDTLALGELSYAFDHDLCLGHKVALCDIPEGAKVLKYGMSIGVASKPIARGEHVHLHNLESEYTATFTLDDDRRYA